MKDKIKSLFVSLHTWQIMLFLIIGAIAITNLITVLVSLWVWHEIQINLIVLGTINAVLVPFIILPVVIRNLRQVVKLEEDNRSHLEMISQLKQRSEIDAAIQRRADEMSLLCQLGVSLASGKNLYDTLLALQAEMVKLIQADAFYVAIYDEKTDIVRYPVYFDEDEPQPETDRLLHEWPGLTGAVIFNGKTLYLPDMFDPEVEKFYRPHNANDLILHTFLGIPLKVDGHSLGMLSVQSKVVDAYSADQIQFMENLAVQAAIAIDKANLLDRLKQELSERERAEAQLREREAILESVTFAAEQFLKSPNWRTNIDIVLERLGKTLNVTHAYLFEDHLDSQGVPVTSMRYEWTAPGYPSDLDGGYFQNSKINQRGFEDQVEALRRGDARIGNSSTFNAIEKESMDEFGVKSILEMPIFVSGKEWGAIGFDDLEQEREWRNAEVEALKIATGILSAAIQRQEAESAVRESERIYRQAIEAAGAVPYYLNYETDRYQFMGQGIQKLTGYAPDEMTVSLWHDLLQEQELVGDLAGLDIDEATRRVRSGELNYWRCDSRILTREGQSKWIVDSAIQLFNDGGISHASVGILQDITDRKLIEDGLRQREAILGAVTFAAEQFLKTSDWRMNINTVLARLGKTIDATHVYLFEHRVGAEGVEVASLTYEWTVPGFPNDLDNPAYQSPHLIREGVDSSDDWLRRGEVFMGNSATFPEVEKERLKELGIKAVLEVPLFVDGAWWGTIGFDDMVVERNWSSAEVEALKIAAGILSTAIHRQEAESAVRESEAIYRKAIEAAGAVPYYIDYESDRYLFMGEGIRQMVGYEPEEMSPAVWRRSVQETIMQGEATGLSVPEAAKLARRGKIKTWRSDVKIQMRDGQQRWLFDSGIELFGDQNVSYAAIGILQDITDRKLTEANLRKRESVLEAITFAAEQFLKTSNWRERIGIVLERLGKEFTASHAYLFEKHKNPGGEILSSMTYEWTTPECVSDLENPEFQDLPPQSMGFERMYEILDRGEPLIGSTSYFNEAEWKYMQAINVKALLEIRVIVNGEHWGTIGVDDIVNKREWTPIEVDVIRVAANVLGAAIKRQMDEDVLEKELDERKRLIEELEIRNAESETLRETTVIVTSTLDIAEAVQRILKQLRRVVAYDSASVWLYKGNVAHMIGGDGMPNEMEKDKHYTISEIEPDYPLWVQDLPYILVNDIQADYPQFREPPINYIHGWLTIPLKVRGRLSGFISLDGRRVGQFTERNARLALNYANQVSIALENARLFSDLQNQLSERQKLIGELENKNTELERFTYTVSHDLKSPLVTINGFLGYLEQDAISGNTERLRKDIQRIHEAVNKMQRLLNELLELSRVGRMMNAPEKIPFADLVSEAMNIVHGQLEARGVSVQISSPLETQPNLPVVYGDKPRLVEVLQNLLDNAAKYMGAEAHPHIEVGQHGDENGKLIFYVKDNGIGIAPQYHERVFGLFDKLDPKSEGTGVGLALVKRIIEVHGGRIWIESELGQGSTFYFTLPEKGES